MREVINGPLRFTSLWDVSQIRVLNMGEGGERRGREEGRVHLSSAKLLLYILPW